MAAFPDAEERRAVNGGGLARRLAISRLAIGLTAACTAITLGTLFFILGYIVWKGAGTFSPAFLVRLPVPVGETGGGIANAITGSFKIVSVAALMGVPLGILAGIYTAEYGKSRMAHAIRYCADTLNGVPSIVMGIFAYGIVVLPMRHFSGFAGSVALAIIIIPMVLKTTEEFVKAVPVPVREAALALGLPNWKAVLRVVVPTASRGIMTGIVLAVSRVAGETAPLIFTAFGNRNWDSGMLGPVASLPLMVFTYAISPYEDWHRQAWAAAMVLLLVVLGGSIASRLLMGRRDMR
jgi:phosphate transport system permease protein